MMLQKFRSRVGALGARQAAPLPFVFKILPVLLLVWVLGCGGPAHSNFTTLWLSVPHDGLVVFTDTMPQAPF